MIVYNGNNNKLINAVFDTNSFLDGDKLWNVISRKSSFDMSTAYPGTIASIVRSYYKDNIIAIHTYRSKNPWSKTYGFTEPDRPGIIFVNERKFGIMDNGDFVGLFVHEIVHLADISDSIHSFGHGNNSSIGKENTASYFIGRLADAMIMGRPTNHKKPERKFVTKKRPWYKRFLNWLR